MPDSQPDRTVMGLALVNWDELVPEAARRVAEFYMQPINISGLVGSMVLPLVMFRHKPPLVPYLFAALVGWAGGRMAYQATRDLHDLAEYGRSQV